MIEEPLPVGEYNQPGQNLRKSHKCRIYSLAEVTG